ncbi:DUF961 family protein [Listeria booriae]|uniref:DUF961 family protein n=1 Tax=Listeria booriae TaxID=1552123 RepID=A0A841XAH5_9LIST|nr:DUF961 family protein [Listeria booriae]MBC1284882.1 DUF961 family protein [Listeria booriae]MBC1565066.1 DUF961 family protein [Listeria booriae]
MRLNEEIVIDNEKTFGEVKFIGAVGEVMKRVDGETTGDITSRRYNLKSSNQERVVTVYVPVAVGEKNFPPNTVVELVNPSINIIPNVQFSGVQLNWLVNVDDIKPKNVSTRDSAPKQPEKPQEHNGDKK